MQEVKEQVKEIAKQKSKKVAIKVAIKIFSVVGGALVPFLLIGFLTFMLSIIVVQESAVQSEEAMKLTEMSSNVLEDMLETAYQAHVKYAQKDIWIDFIELLAFGATKAQGDWENFDTKIIREAADAIGKNPLADIRLRDMSDDPDTFDFYCNIYGSIFPDYIGYYDVKINDDETETKYGMKNFYPMANGFKYTHYDDYGDERTYQGSSVHEGNDIMAAKRVPIIAIEDGTVENLGWNEWGGYRVGIRSHDGKRYYYYAHMLAEHPYAEGMRKDKSVHAGDVIGFVGATGYSPKEGTTDLFPSHVHVQIEVTYTIDGEEEKCWINPYAPLKFIESHRKADLIKGKDDFDYTRDKGS